MKMARKIPQIPKGKKILIICEGYEEFDYFTKLKDINVWDSGYIFKLKNAKSIDNIFPIYQNEYQNDNYDLVLIYCDTEVYPYLQYKKLLENINNFHGNKAGNKVVIFANPCTMQIILSHFSSVKLQINSKFGNAKLIANLTGVVNYVATEQQRTAIMNKINSTNYFTMKNNLVSLSNNFAVVPSTNVLDFFNNFENKNFKWINAINRYLEK
jgi:hypothetical protein